MLVQYDELTIRAMRAMRYAAALTVQAADCSFWPEQLLAVVGCASLQRQCWLDNTARSYEPAIDRITRPRTAAETTTARVPHK